MFELRVFFVVFICLFVWVFLSHLPWVLFLMCLDHVLHRMEFLLTVVPRFTSLVSHRQNWAVFFLSCPSLWLHCPLNLGKKKDVVVYLLHIHLMTVAMILLPSARQEKKPPPPPKKSLTVKMYFFMTYSLCKYSLVLSGGWCAFWAYQRSVMFMLPVSFSSSKHAFNRPILSLWKQDSSFWKLPLFFVTQIC